MILIDIDVPVISQKIEVRADEEKNVGLFKEELCLLIKKMIGEKEEIVRGFELYDVTRKETLPDSLTLSECGIAGGSKLILI